MNVTVQEAVDDLPPVHVTGPKSHQDRYHLDETTFSNMEGRLRVTVSESPAAHSLHRLGGHVVCVFITAGPITKLFAGGGGGEWTTCAMIDDEPRPVWMSPLITH